MSSSKYKWLHILSYICGFTKYFCGLGWWILPKIDPAVSLINGFSKSLSDRLLIRLHQKVCLMPLLLMNSGQYYYYYYFILPSREIFRGCFASCCTIVLLLLKAVLTRKIALPRSILTLIDQQKIVLNSQGSRFHSTGAQSCSNKCSFVRLTFQFAVQY